MYLHEYTGCSYVSYHKPIAIISHRNIYMMLDTLWSNYFIAHCGRCMITLTIILYSGVQ